MFLSFSSQGSFSSLQLGRYICYLKVSKTVFIFFANHAKTKTKFCSYTVLFLRQVFLFGAVRYFQYPIENGKVLYPKPVVQSAHFFSLFLRIANS